MGPINAGKIVKNAGNIQQLKMAAVQGSISFQGVCGCVMS